jgi:phosphatidylserine synthase
LVNHYAESPAGWRSLFWVTVIFAAFAFILGFLMIPRFERPASKPSVDYLGLSTFTSGTAMLVYGLNDAESRGWKSPAIIVTIILGVLTLVSFPIIESKVSNPAIPPSILRDRHVQLPLTIFMFIGGGW